MINFLQISIAILGTTGAYLIAKKVHSKVSKSFTIPILTSTFIIVVTLLLFQIPYDMYMVGGKWIDELLGPAVVALAYPLYHHRKLLQTLALPILAGTIMGAIIGISSGVLFAKWLGFTNEIIITVSSKSVTTPVSMAITDSTGGITPLAAILVMVAGITGSIISQYIFKIFHITSYLGRGIGLGSASHAIGTATSMENNELQGTISSVAMVISAMIVSVITPTLIDLLL